MNANRQKILNALELFSYNRARAAKHIGMTADALRRSVHKMRSQGVDIPDNAKSNSPSGRQEAVDPTPEEIRALCVEIRKTWGPERMRRYEQPPVVMLHAHTVGTSRGERLYKMLEA